jgi:glycosyltransferase involved in cell wall biosynthesis
MKRKILFLAQTYPFPPAGGVSLRTFNILRQLTVDYEIDLLAFDRMRNPPHSGVPPGHVLALEGVTAIRVYKIPQHISRARLLTDHLHSLLSRRVYSYYRLRSRDLLADVVQTFRDQEPAMVHLDSLDLSAALQVLPPERVAVTHHNVESELLERRSEIETNSIKRNYFRLQARLQVKEERTWCPRVALNVTVSDRDGVELARRAGGGRFVTAPNGVDLEYFSPGDIPVEQQSGIVFVGGTTWFPNRDALEYFAAELYPRLLDNIPHVEVTWVGRALPEEMRRFGDMGIRMTGFVDDIRDIVRNAACFVMPFRVGGGTRLKLLDAWAMGKAVVSTTQGAEGVDARDGENIIIRDDPEAFVDAVVGLLRDSRLRSELGRAARRLTETTYGWEAIGASLRREYADLMESAT